MVNRSDECKRHCFWDSFSQLFINPIVYEISTVGVIFPAGKAAKIQKLTLTPTRFIPFFEHFFAFFSAIYVLFRFVYCLLLILFPILFFLPFSCFLLILFSGFSCLLYKYNNNNNSLQLKLYSKTYINFYLTLIRQNWQCSKKNNKQ